MCVKGKDAAEGGQPLATAEERAMDGPEVDSAARLDESAQALIGQHLKAIYSEIVQEQVPDHLLKLLAELERKERES